MQYDDQLGSTVLNQIHSLPFWRDFENRLAVAITGSVGAGMGDEHSDLDVEILVPEKDSIPLYENYKKGYEEGTIDVLNPQAFLFDEFPMVRLAEVDGHHRAMVFEFDRGECPKLQRCRPLGVWQLYFPARPAGQA